MDIEEKGGCHWRKWHMEQKLNSVTYSPCFVDFWWYHNIISKSCAVGSNVKTTHLIRFSSSFKKKKSKFWTTQFFSYREYLIKDCSKLHSQSHLHSHVVHTLLPYIVCNFCIILYTLMCEALCSRHINKFIISNKVMKHVVYDDSVHPRERLRLLCWLPRHRFPPVSFMWFVLFSSNTGIAFLWFTLQETKINNLRFFVIQNSPILNMAC